MLGTGIRGTTHLAVSFAEEGRSITARERPPPAGLGIVVGLDERQDESMLRRGVLQSGLGSELRNV